MIICTILSHYLQLVALPDYSKDVFINSDTNTCRVYSPRTWDVVNDDNVKGKHIVVISNGVIEVSGYKLEGDK
jgi:hypothetical protein